MRELERDLPATNDAIPDTHGVPARLVVVGAGRAGGSIALAARAARIEVEVVGHDGAPVVGAPQSAAVLLCVPDAAVTAACERLAETIVAGTAVGHVSGATPLSALAAAAAAGCPTFSMHPLQTIPSPTTELAGAPCAVAGSSEAALATARALAGALGMRPFDVPEDGRAGYHAAAAMASNFLVALEESAAGLMDAAGVANAREILAPLVLRTAANWADAGGEALTGPIARGDGATVSRHLAALRELAPELVALYETLADRTQALAAEREQGS